MTVICLIRNNQFSFVLLPYADKAIDFFAHPIPPI